MKLSKNYYRAQLIGPYGIQRARKQKQHNYIAGQLYSSRKPASDSAKCLLNVDDYIGILTEKSESPS